MASHDDAPPPYSVTDIYSSRSTSDSHSMTGHSIVAVSVAAPSSGNVAPYSTTLSSPLPAPTYDSNLPPAGTSSSDCLDPELGPSVARAATSAAAYFAAHPAPPPQPATGFSQDAAAPRQLIHYDLPVVISAGTSYQHLPFPANELSQRNISAVDWRTFLNFLLPTCSENRSKEANSFTIDEIGCTLDEKEFSDLTTRSTSLRSNDSSPLSISMLDNERTALNRQQNLEIDTVLHQWNEGYFAPRGVTIGLRKDPGDAYVPPLNLSHESTQPTSSAAPSLSASNRQGTLSFAGLTIEDDRVVIGNNHLVADRTGLRIGGLKFDERGISYGDRKIVPAVTPPAGASPRPRPVRSANAKFVELPDATASPRLTTSQVSAAPTSSAGTYAAVTDEHTPRRRRSVSSVSTTSSESTVSTPSSSSSSSDGSAASIGSLPPCNKLDDRQLPAAHAHLQRWLNHPDQPVTRECVDAAKNAIKKGGRIETSLAYSDLPTGTYSVAPILPVEATVLRAEVKDMMKRWKTLKRQQKQLYRQQRRQRRQLRKQRNRERRQLKRQDRQQRRELKREAKQLRKQERKKKQQAKRVGRSGPSIAPPVVGGFGVYTGYAHSHNNRNYQPDHPEHIMHQTCQFDGTNGHRESHGGKLPHFVPRVPGVPGLPGLPSNADAYNTRGALNTSGTSIMPGSPSTTGISTGARITQSIGDAVAARFGNRTSGDFGPVVSPLLGGMLSRFGSMGLGRANTSGSWGSRGGRCESSFSGFSRSQQPLWESANSKTARDGSPILSPQPETSDIKYQRAMAAEQILAEKQSEIAGMQAQLQRMIESRLEGGDGSEEPKAHMQRKEIETLASEVEQLAEHIELLRLDADQTYARELEKKEEIR
ncbi:hypothetical protein SEPCBS57363_006326 [Sporothrix epigloea]|uniref:Uncharacterized protein n=1 Tax=Sporothrix epigloea TaxID=1892477 RepID=A0ABP0E2H1_9PEZI